MSINLSIIQQILYKIRTLCKECQISTLPTKITYSELTHLLTVDLQFSQNCLPTYLTALDELRYKVFSYNELEEQYIKLQDLLQKNQTEIRRHIGVSKIQQEFKLYMEAIKQQYLESENSRLELMESSRTMIKQLKLQNQKLNDKINARQWDFKLELPSKKNIYPKKERTRTDYSYSEQISHASKPAIETLYGINLAEKSKRTDFNTQLTERPNNSRKKKYRWQKKKHQLTFSFLMENEQQKKKRQKKFLLPSPEMKKMNSGFKNGRQSDKKLHKSLQSLANDVSQQKKVNGQKMKIFLFAG